MSIRKFTILLSMSILLCLDVSLYGQSFPLSKSPNERYLVDQNGTPFPILGRTAWFITSLTTAEYQIFIDDTAAKGYTAIEFHVLNHDPRGNNPPYAGNGSLPFTKKLNGSTWTGGLYPGQTGTNLPDFTTPNESYWTHVDGILNYAESKGMLVFMFPAYVGCYGCDQGWMQEMVDNGPTRMQTYGYWIASRYVNRGNIVWMMGGDNGSFNSAQLAVEQSLLTGLKTKAGQQSTFFSAEWGPDSIATDQSTFGYAMSLNGAYSWTNGSTYQCRRAYSYSTIFDTRPAFLLEEPYDQEGPDGNNVNPSATQPVRRFQWWGWLSSIGGYISGNGYIWPFNSGWQTHLNTQGAQDMARMNAFINSIEWWHLIPSGLGGTGNIVTAGGSTPTSSNYVSAACTYDGTMIVAYVPPAHTGTITIDMSRMAGLSTAQWFNPTTAVYTAIGSNLPNSGTRVFTPPGNNGSGYSDWVLVIESPPNPADLNHDGVVDFIDYGIFEPCMDGPGVSPVGICLDADFDDDNDVDLEDFGFFQYYW